MLCLSFESSILCFFGSCFTSHLQGDFCSMLKDANVKHIHDIEINLFSYFYFLVRKNLQNMPYTCILKYVVDMLFT